VETTTRSGDDVTLRLPDPARLRVTVDGLPSGTVVEYALRTFSGGSVGSAGGFRDFAAPTGETAPFSPGDGVLLVRAKGHGWAAVRISALEGSTPNVTVALPRSGSVEGRVRDPSLGERGLVRLARREPLFRDDLPAHGALAELRGHYEWVNPAADGSFRLADVPPGAYELSYGRIESSVWHAVATERIDVASGETVARDLGR
jgi:hypothetical protein